MTLLPKKLTSHYSAIFEFDNLEEAARECAARQSLLQRWHSRPAGSDVFVCDLENLERALKRLHLVKSSPDGLTAEMLRQLPENELRKSGCCHQGNVSFLVLCSKLDCHHGFVDPQERNHEILV